jgi:uncharacterized protein (DUF1800 family)
MSEANEANAVSRRTVLKGAGLTATAMAAAPSLLRAESPALRVTRERATQGSGPSLPSAAIVTLNRAGLGPRAGDVAAFQALGTTDESRITAWVGSQLNPGTIDDSGFQARIAAAGFESYGISTNPNALLATLWDWYVNGNAPSGNTSSSIPRDELVRATMMRAIYSRRQLVEVLADFWRDHFNVNTELSSYVRATVPHLELILRQRTFGRFRDMLGSVASSTAMLRYLDNYTSSNAGPNENFSRELFELHTLGAENYYGVLPQNEVPTDPQGIPIGYVDADVFEAVRCFTGWSFSHGNENDGDTGLFYYRPDWHDRFQKYVLGLFIPPDQVDLKDGNDVLDRLAAHPGTGRHIARKLCQKLISDTPPQSLIDSVAALFTEQWQAPDQLKQVYRAILLSDEFRTTWGEKIKRPFEIVVGAMRACSADFTMKMDDSDTNSFLWRYEQTGHELFVWPSPNGYPDARDAWQSMTPRVMTWRMCGWLVDFRDSNDNHYLDVLGQTPPSVRSSNELADYWIFRVLYRSMDPLNRAQIVQFMSQGVNPDLDLDLTNEGTRDRVRSMVGLLLMSPDFLWR